MKNGRWEPWKRDDALESIISGISGIPDSLDVGGVKKTLLQISMLVTTLMLRNQSSDC